MNSLFSHWSELGEIRVSHGCATCLEYHHQLVAIYSSHGCCFWQKELQSFIPFPTLKDMEGLPRPPVYQNNPCLRAIIDCTEFYIQKPSLPSSHRRTHSTYKSNNTFKLFISIFSSSTYQLYFTIV